MPNQSNSKLGNNHLYPVFIKTESLHFVIVGGGKVAGEKLRFLFKSSPGTFVTVIAPVINEEITRMAAKIDNLKITCRTFREKDLEQADILILATGDPDLNGRIRVKAREKKILVNVADTPSLCDFYMGSIVTRGDLKIAISTNGKSPTLSKRIREYLEEAIPDSTREILYNLGLIRSRLRGDFNKKMKTLNQITANLAEKNV